MLSVSLLLAAVLIFLNTRDADPALQRAAFTEPQLPASYVPLEEALASGDVTALEELAHADDSYRAYLSAMHLASLEQLPPATRLSALERGLALRIDDALQRRENLDLLITQAELALAAGETDKALSSYRAALPDSRAVAPFTQLETDLYRCAAAFQTPAQTRALEALDGRAAPSIEAPALRALGRYSEALDAYRRWLAEAPSNEAALLGEAWCLFYLGRDAEDVAAFTALGASGHYGLGLLANRAGDIDRAVEHLVDTGRRPDGWPPACTRRATLRG